MFETLDQAATYRKFVTQELVTSVADMFTLDGGKLSGRGVVVRAARRLAGGRA